jgi:hypothetical protein
VSNKHKKKLNIVAWLITWEWAAEHAKVEEKIAAIINYRRSAEYVRDITELLCANHSLTLKERIEYAKNKRNPIFPAKIYNWRVHCGDNPHLWARLVDDLHVEIDENGNEKLAWKERPISESLLK